MTSNSAVLDTAFRALSDRTRRAVIERLTGGVATVSELAKPFDMALPSFIQHIHVLERAGFIETIKVGRTRECRIVPAKLEQTGNWLKTQRELWERRLGQLEDYVERLHRGDDEDE